MEIELTQAIPAPAPIVWEVLTDLDAAPTYTRAIEAVERVGDTSGFAVGTRWRETRTMFGKQSTEEMEVTSVEDGRSYVIESHGHGAHYRTVLEVVSSGPAASTLTMRFGGEPEGAVAKAMASTVGRLFKGATVKALKADLEDIEAESMRRAAG